jgi:hypothetical protein
MESLGTRNWRTKFLNKKWLNMNKEIAYGEKINKHHQISDKKFRQIFRQNEV